MSAFGDMQDLLADFLAEAGELLDDVDSGLLELEKTPGDDDLLNRIFRGFHTIKGGAGFLEATELVELCHRGESLLDLLRGHKLNVTPEIMDLILAATGEVRRMFDEMTGGMQPTSAPTALLRGLEAAVRGESVSTSPSTLAQEVSPSVPTMTEPVSSVSETSDGLDWMALYQSAFGGLPSGHVPSDQSPRSVVSNPEPSPKPTSKPPVAKPVNTGGPKVVQKESTIRVDTQRFDQILNLSGEIGLTKNRLNSLRASIIDTHQNDESSKVLDSVLSQLDSLVSDLQSAVMKARMQPVGRVFQKYSRLARDLARQLGKDVELEITGADTEVDKTILEELNDPLVHLIRNSVDHGVETIDERRTLGKPTRGVIHLSAKQTGDSIIIEIEDDGKGMDPEIIRQKAIEKGAISPEQAGTLTPQQCLQLIFLPGFSTKTNVSDLSGRGVGMDVVKTNIEKLKGRVDIQSTVGSGTKMIVSLPLTLAILPVLMLRLLNQIYALPLSSVREIITLEPQEIQQVNGEPNIIIRGEVLPIFDLAQLIGLNRQGDHPPLAVVLSHGDRQLVLGVDGFVGQDEVMIKPLEGIHPKGVAGATLSGDGTLVLVLELKELLEFEAA